MDSFGNYIWKDITILHFVGTTGMYVVTETKSCIFEACHAIQILILNSASVKPLLRRVELWHGFKNNITLKLKFENLNRDPMYLHNVYCLSTKDNFGARINFFWYILLIPKTNYLESFLYIP